MRTDRNEDVVIVKGRKYLEGIGRHAPKREKSAKEAGFATVLVPKYRISKVLRVKPARDEGLTAGRARSRTTAEIPSRASMEWTAPRGTKMMPSSGPAIMVFPSMV